jgi:hypothetical protein
MWWMVGLLLMGMFGRALAQDSLGGSEQMEVENARRASDQAIVRFNTDIKDFPSWEIFEAVVLAQVTPGMMGTCYAYQGGTVRVTMEPLPRVDKDTGWQQTAGTGWQQTQTDRTFIEYRYNEKAGVLLWVEGVNPRFFFAYTRKMCELPLGTVRQ